MDKTREQLTRIARSTAEKVGVARPLTDDDIELVGGYSAGTFGIPDDVTLDAIRTTARLEGVLTDPVYEGKSMAGLMGMVRSGEIAGGAKVLYAHLGGQPALSAYASVL